MKPLQMKILLLAKNQALSAQIGQLLAEIPEFSAELHTLANLAQAEKLLQKTTFNLLLLNSESFPAKAQKELEKLITLQFDVPLILIGSARLAEQMQTWLQKGALDYLPQEELSAILLGKTLQLNLERFKLQQQLRDITAKPADDQESHYQLILDLVPEGIITINRQGFVTECNASFNTLTGFSQAEIVGKHVSQLPTIRKQDIPKYVKIFGAALLEKLPQPFEFTWQHKDGSLHYGQARTQLLRKGRQSQEILITLSDITKLKAVERKIQESEKQYRTLIENSYEAILVAQDGKIKFHNPRTKELLAYTDEEIRSHNFVDFIHPEDRQLVLDRYTRRMKGEDIPKTYSFRFVSKKGETHWVQINAVNIEWEGRDATLNFLTDISEQKMTDAALAASERKWRTLFENLRDGWFSTDLQGNFIECNQAYLDLLGYSLKELRTKKYQELTPEKWHQFEEMIVQERIVQRGYSGVYQKENIRADDKIIPVELSIYLSTDKQDKPTGMWGLARDISDRKAKEDALHVSEQFYRLTLGNMTEAIFITDDAGEFTYISPSTNAIFGYNADEIREMGTIQKLFKKKILRLEDLKAKGTLANLEWQITDKQGQAHDLLVTAKYVPIGRGTILYTCRDITQRKAAEQHLQEERQRLYQVLDLLPGIVYLQAPDYSIRFANKEFRRSFGDDFSLPCYTIIHGRQAPCAECPTFDVFKTGKMNTYEWLDENGRTFLTYDYPFKDTDGSPLVLEFGLDITDRKQAEVALKDSEEQFRLIWEHSPIGLRLTDSTGKVVLANSTYCKLFQKPKAEILGKPLSSVYTELPGEHILETYRKRFQERKIKKDTESELPLWNGEKIWMSVSNTFLKYGTPEQTYVLSTFKDISREKAAEKELSESEARFRSLYENSTVGLYRTSPDGQIFLANSTLVHMLGYDSFDQLAQRNLEQEGFEPQYPRSQFRTQLETEGQISGLESAWKRRDGSVIYVRESARAVQDPDGKVLYYEGTVEDITERRQAEEATWESEFRYRTLFESANDAIFVMEDERFIDCNARTLKLFGCRREEIIDKKPYEFSPAEQPDGGSPKKKPLKRSKPLLTVNLNSLNGGINDWMGNTLTRK